MLNRWKHGYPSHLSFPILLSRKQVGVKNLKSKIGGFHHGNHEKVGYQQRSEEINEEGNSKGLTHSRFGRGAVAVSEAGVTEFAWA